MFPQHLAEQSSSLRPRPPPASTASARAPGEARRGGLDFVNIGRSSLHGRRPETYILLMTTD